MWFLSHQATKVISYSSSRKLTHPSKTDEIHQSGQQSSRYVIRPGLRWLLGLASASVWVVVIEHPEKDWGSLEGLPSPGSLGSVPSSFGLLSRCSHGWEAWVLPKGSPELKLASLSFPSVGPFSTGNSGRAPRSPRWEQETLGVQGEFRSKVPS